MLVLEGSSARMPVTAWDVDGQVDHGALDVAPDDEAISVATAACECDELDSVVNIRAPLGAKATTFVLLASARTSRSPACFVTTLGGVSPATPLAPSTGLIWLMPLNASVIMLTWAAPLRLAFATGVAEVTMYVHATNWMLDPLTARYAIVQPAGHAIVVEGLVSIRLTRISPDTVPAGIEV